MNTKKTDKSQEKVNPINPNPTQPMTTLVLNFKNLLARLLPGAKPDAADSVNRQETKANELGEYENADVQKTLDSSYCPECIRDARALQDIYIKNRFAGQNLRFADIGCGDGYHGEIFAPAAECYHGYEISKEMAAKTGGRWQKAGLDNAKVILGDAGVAEIPENFYDVAWSLYFTAGNFRDEFADISDYSDEYLNSNPAFGRIIGNFYRALKPGGSLFLCVYKDIPKTEEAQRIFYKNTGQTVITPLGSRFVASKENFWSVRFTKESMLSNLSACGIKPEQVTFHDLNEISWFVEVVK
jgi:SAM-dependent methyltransferase